MNSRNGLIVSLSIFIFCCATDYLDGYYARTHKQITKIGQMLDPLADKILIAITILFIVGFNMVSQYSLIPASIILCREIIISGVRDVSERSGYGFKTSKLSKWKTVTQMISMALILFSEIINSKNILCIGEILLWLASVIAVISGLIYCKRYLRLLLK
jgi:cardiolipin synthase